MEGEGLLSRMSHPFSTSGGRGCSTASVAMLAALGCLFFARVELLSAKMAVLRAVIQSCLMSREDALK